MPTDLQPLRDADVPAVAAVVRACDVEELGFPDFEEDDVRAELAEPGIDPDRDARVARDGGGRVVGYGLLLGTDARAWVHPDARGAGHGTALAGFLEGRARARGQGRVDQQRAEANPHAAALLAARGYVRLRRYARAWLPAEEALAFPDPPPGVRPYDRTGDGDGVLEIAHLQLSAAGLRAAPVEALLERPEASRSWWVREGEGVVPAVVLADLRADGEGYIGEVAVDARHRGRRLAEAPLRAAARDLARRGATRIALHVRSDNPPALALYERLGFRIDWEVEELRLDLR